VPSQALHHCSGSRPSRGHEHDSSPTFFGFRCISIHNPACTTLGTFWYVCLCFDKLTRNVLSPPTYPPPTCFFSTSATASCYISGVCTTTFLNFNHLDPSVVCASFFHSCLVIFPDGPPVFFTYSSKLSSSVDTIITGFPRCR
jgi:hypothetical protein